MLIRHESQAANQTIKILSNHYKIRLLAKLTEKFNRYYEAKRQKNQPWFGHTINQGILLIILIRLIHHLGWSGNNDYHINPVTSTRPTWYYYRYYNRYNNHINIYKGTKRLLTLILCFTLTL